MFTGIVQGLFPVKKVDKLSNLNRVTVLLSPELLSGLKVGCSLSVMGCCLTVTDFNYESVTFDIIKETLRVTNLGDLKPSDKVNIERSARFGDEIGGHILSGHINDTIEICNIKKEKNNMTLFFKHSPKWTHYLLPKGYVSLNGCSLTIGEQVEDERFCVHLIPETLRTTSFGCAKIGDKINLEIDSHTYTIVTTVKNFLEYKPEPNHEERYVK